MYRQARKIGGGGGGGGRIFKSGDLFIKLPSVLMRSIYGAGLYVRKSEKYYRVREVV